MTSNEIRLFTIGFTRKSAKVFFDLLRTEGVRKVIDVRLNNSSQLAGFTKKDDLAFFLGAIAGIDYVHEPDLAPSEELFSLYKSKALSREEFGLRFEELLHERKPEARLRPEHLDSACLLCSESEAASCHRTIVAEHFRRLHPEIRIIHL